MFPDFRVLLLSGNQRSVCWLLSAYSADSHRAWSNWLQKNLSEIEWYALELPGRHFRWRIRGNPLSWLDQLPQQDPDLILATSMVDLATLRGLHPRLSRVPAIYYFHENQFAYPLGENQVRSVEPQMVQLYGALAAQKIVFNSRFNRDSFLDGVESLMGKMPDATPAGLQQRLEQKAEICPVPVSPVSAVPPREDRLILWNHRWEYDKAPDLFADAMIELADKGAEFRLALLGPRHDRTPSALERLRHSLGKRIVVDGRLPEQEYKKVLGRAGIVVSTALHEFQGLSVMEAVSAGVRPLVPDALCYPEQYAPLYRYRAGDREALVEKLTDWLTGGLPPEADVSAWYDTNLKQQWSRLIAAGSVV